jgi:hypothetical protein
MHSIVNEKPRTVTPIKLPNPAKGTPKRIQKAAKAIHPTIEIIERVKPRTETHASGCAL